MKKWFTLKNKLWKVMKICTLQVAVALMFSGMVLAHDNYGQILDKKITISLKDVSIEEALRTLEQLTNVKFFYSLDQLGITDRVSIEAKDLPLRDVLSVLLQPHGVRFKVHEKTAMITLKKLRGSSQGFHPENSGENPASAGGTQQFITAVTGVVTDASTQRAMAGVNVIVKGTTQGTTTSSDGTYSIVAGASDILVFSFIGFKPVEVRVENQTVIDVVMFEDITGLKEVEINAGYWTVEGRQQTGNIARVDAQEIKRHPVSNPIAALQARVAGVEIVQQTGVPGGNFTVRIRGQNSIGNGNDPLYIIDGVPFTGATMSFNETSAELLGNATGLGGNSPLNAINPADIESIEVLKDADATAIYGSRGSNGVILVTTKKGVPGRTKVDFNFYSGGGKVASKMDLLNTSQYVRMRKEAFENENLGMTSLSAPDVLVWDTTRYVDWQNELIGGTATFNDAQLSVAGGDRLTQFSFAAGYHSEGTVFPGDDQDRRFSLATHLNTASSDQKFSATVGIKYSINDTDLIKRDLTGTALTLPPNAPPLYNDTGALNWGTDMSTDTWVFPVLSHPLSYLKTGYESLAKNLFINSVLQYELLKRLNVRLNIGYSDVAINTVTTTPRSSLPPNSSQPNTTAFSNSNFRNWTAEPILNWTPAIGRSQFDVLIGASLLEQIQEGTAQFASGFTSEYLMKNISAASDRTIATNQYSEYRYEAVFGRINYSYRDKYIVNLTGRRDGSSRFGEHNRFASFGAAGLAWIMSEEPFLKSAAPILSFGKLRGSYGISGNDQLANYEYLDAYTSSGLYQTTVALTPLRVANPDFAWETNKKLEGAVELSFFHDRAFLSASYYRNRSSNQLVGIPLPPTTGFTIMQGNLPAVVENSGWELQLSSVNVDKQVFKWSTSVNLTMPRNELLEFPDLENSSVYANRLVIGEPLSILKRYEYLGVDPQTGVYQFRDFNEDGMINSADQKAIRFVGQTLYGGLHNSVQYKGFHLDVLFQFVEQTKANYLNAFGLPPGGGISNQPAWVLDRWRAPGDETDIQKFSRASAQNTTYSRLRNSSMSVSDGSYVRLKNVHLSYAVPAKIATSLRMETLRFFVQGQNLLTWTSFKGLDPEVTSATSLPPLRVITGGVNVSF